MTCTLGMHIVGFAMVCMSACAAVSSFACGKLQPIVGRTALFLTGKCITVLHHRTALDACLMFNNIFTSHQISHCHSAIYRY